MGMSLAVESAFHTRPSGYQSGTVRMSMDSQQGRHEYGTPRSRIWDRKVTKFAGRDASADAVEAAGRECRVEWCRDGDPNDELAADLIERAAIREFDGGATREDADQGAWYDLMRGIGR